MKNPEWKERYHNAVWVPRFAARLLVHCPWLTLREADKVAQVEFEEWCHLMPEAAADGYFGRHRNDL